MRAILLVLAGVVLLSFAAAPCALAQTPHVINYDGRLDVEDAPASGSYSISFRMYETADGGSSLWSETHEVEVSDGLFSVLLGTLNELPPAIIQDNDELYLAVAVEGGAEMQPRLFLASTVFSIRAAYADEVRVGAIGAGHLANGSVSGAKLADDAVSASKIEDEAVSSAKLADGAVTENKLADSAVTASKLAGGAAVTSVNSVSGPIEIRGAGLVDVDTEGNQITVSVLGRDLNLSPSSIRWKRDVEPLREALDTVSRLRGVSYEWKDTGEKDIGLIAEEVGAVLPQIVEFEEEGPYAKTVDYARLVAVLIQAVNEQQAELDERNRIIGDLVQRVERLEDHAAAAESLVSE